MEDEDVLHLRSLFEALDHFSLLVISRISLRSHDHTDRSHILPFDFAPGEAPVDTGLENGDNISLHAHQDRLGLRVPESGIEFQYLRITIMDHQAGIDDALVRSSLFSHSLNDRP